MLAAEKSKALADVAFISRATRRIQDIIRTIQTDSEDRKQGEQRQTRK
jgi:Flp pilus assembly CpaE family ATPase